MGKNSSISACPCGDGRFDQCCGRFIVRHEIPQTAEKLMRSRYSAYVLRDEKYLKSTWYSSSRPSGPLFDEHGGMKLIDLKICSHARDGNWATVEFIARYKLNGRAQRLHEISRFVFEDSRWFYLDGDFPENSRK